MLFFHGRVKVVTVIKKLVSEFVKKEVNNFRQKDVNNNIRQNRRQQPQKHHSVASSLENGLVYASSSDSLAFFVFSNLLLWHAS